MGLEGARVLLVDDHPDLAENIQEILEDEGAQVVLASTAAEALERTAADLDLALVDIRLPDAKGLSLIPEIKRRSRGLTEVLLITGDALLEDAIDAVKFGAYDYLLKPFDPETLLSTLERARESVRLRREKDELSRALARSEENLRTLVDTVGALLLVLDDRGRVILANPAVANASGQSQEELVGVDWFEVHVPRSQRVDARARFSSLLASGRPASFEGRVTRADGRGDRRVLWQWSRLQVPSGSYHVYASGQDVSSLRELERRTKLAEKLAAVGTLAAGLAHEIRNPLNAATLQLQLLERRMVKHGVPDRLKDPVGVVQSEIKRLSSLVEDFLRFARPTDIHPQKVDLRQIAEHVLKLETPAAEQRGAKLRVDIPAEPVEIKVDLDKIQQVIINLVNNALEAVGQGGEVELVVRQDGDGARIEVNDDGPGIPAEHLARIFEPFFSTKTTGTGLGMAICHSLVQVHGGDIKIRVKDGTKITVELPPEPPKAVAVDPNNPFFR